MAKNDNDRLTLCTVSIHTVTTSTEDNDRMKTARKGCMLAAVSTVK